MRNDIFLIVLNSLSRYFIQHEGRTMVTQVNYVVHAMIILTKIYHVRSLTNWPLCYRDPFHKRFFHHNSNSMEISFSSNSVTDDYIATKFGTCHDSPAVVSCAKYCSDHYVSIWMRAKWNFHHIWIVMEKLLVKWAPDLFASFILSTMVCVFKEESLIKPFRVCDYLRSLLFKTTIS